MLFDERMINQKMTKFRCFSGGCGCLRFHNSFKLVYALVYGTIVFSGFFISVN